MSFSPSLSPRNHGQWVHIAEFLDAQHLALFGLRRVARVAVRAGTELAKAGAATRSAPHGNHGDITLGVAK